MSGLRVSGNTSGNVAEVDANHNVNVTLPLDSNYSGYSMLAGCTSKAGDPAGRITQNVRISTQGRLTVGEPVMLFNEVFNYAAVNTAQWFQTASTQTITVAGGTLNLNAAATTVAAQYCSVKTYAYFPMQADFASYVTMDMSLSNAPQVNCLIELGFINATTNTAPIDGAFFRYDATGTLKAVLNNNGTEYTSSALIAPSVAVMHKYKVIVESDQALFYIDDACQAIIAAPTGLGFPTYAQTVPVMMRIVHSATGPALANTPKFGYVFVGVQDAVGMAKSMAECGAISGKMGSQGQSGQTMGSTALYSNSLAVGPGIAMTNTTAALGVGLGGQFSALPTLAGPTDGILCSFLNPAATSAIPGKTLYIRGVKIQGMVTTILAGGPVLYAFSLAYGHNALTLAQTEGAGTKAPRRISLGYETYAATAAVGSLGSTQGVYMVFNAPIAVNPGEYVAITAKNLGTVTTTGVITFQVTYDSYWE
jgi:hypothetical protein